MPEALITYDGLPVSAGGAHRLRGRDRVAAWATVLRFLTTFTTYREPDSVHLLLAEGDQVDPAFFAEAHRRVTGAFGRAERRVAIGGAVEEREHRWTLNPSAIDSTLAAMEGLEPFPAHWLDAPLVLAVDTTFRLRDPDTGEIFPAQEPELYGNQETGGRRLGESRVYLRLTTRSTCGLFLSLPFAEVTPEVGAYVRRLEDALPFRLSTKHWSRWQLNARGTRYYSRRISLPDE